MHDKSGREVLVAENLHKSYGPRQALRGLSFSLKAGRILGFLGPNGAGKTTSIRILTTMLQPDQGRFEVDGIGSEQHEQIRRRIGVLPEGLGLPPNMTGFEYLTYFGQLYGRKSSQAREKAQSLLEAVGLQQRGRSLIGSYSRGMRQRIGIARALVNDPAVVFLDEPAGGLDPRGRQELLDLVKRIAGEQNTAVVMCSHQLAEIEEICDDVVILSFGQVVARGTVRQVIGRVQQNIILGNALRVQVMAETVSLARQALESVPGILKVTPIGEMDGWLRLELIALTEGDLANVHQINNKALAALIKAKVPILAFEVEGRRLQDVFLRLTEDAIQ